MSPYVLLDDGFHSNPKVLAAGFDGAGLYARALSFCGAYLTDGHISEPAMVALAGGKPGRSALDRCLSAGLITPNAGGYVIPDYLEINDSREEITERRKQKQEAGKKGAAAKHLPKQNPGTSQAGATAGATADGHGGSPGKTVAHAREALSPLPQEQKSPNGDSSDHKQSDISQIKLVLSYANTTLGHKWKPLDVRKTKIRARLREGYTVAQLCKAVDGVLRDPWEDRTVGGNDDPKIIFRDGAQVDKFIALADSGGKNNFSPETAEEREQRMVRQAQERERGRAAS